MKKNTHQFSNYLQNQTLRVWIPPITGFLFYGSWALLINSGVLIADQGSLSAGVKAGLTQGSYSFVITLVLTVMIEWLFVRLQPVPLRSVWVFLLALLVLVVTSSGVNVLAGTPNVLWTILPGLVVSAVYTVLHIVTLHRVK